MYCLLLNSLEKTELWLSIFGNGITILGIISLFITWTVYIKNRFSKHTIKFNIEHLKGKEFSYSFYNSTNKEFAVLDISLLSGKKYVSAQELVPSDFHFPIWQKVKYIHIPAYGHYNGMCEFQTDAQLPKKLKLKISTTHKTLHYSIKFIKSAYETTDAESDFNKQD